VAMHGIEVVGQHVARIDVDVETGKVEGVF
jgi:hypothetical protein